MKYHRTQIAILIFFVGRPRNAWELMMIAYIRDIDQATAIAVVALKNDLGGVGVYVRQALAKIAFFRVDLKYFPMEKFLSQIIE